MDNAQLEIYQTIFPWHPPSNENLLQVKPMIANKSYLLNENIPDIKDFEIIPNSFLTLNALQLWKLNKYNLYFNNLKNITFNQMYLDFGNDILDNRYEMKTIGKLIFKDCSFKDIDIHLCTFIELEFSNCTFDNNVIFRDCMFHKLTFYNCNFSHNVSLQKTHFNDESIFKDSIFKGEINCNTSCFTENTYFNNATFKGYADFHECEFQKNACFYGATFDKAPNFSQAIFVNNLNFVNVTCNFDFKDIQVSIKEEKDRQQDDKKETPNIANDFRDSFRLIKNTLIKENNLLEATNFHKYELYCKEIELDSKKPKLFSKDFIDKIQLFFYRITSNHHTDLLKIINNIILLIALFGIFACIISGFKTDMPSLAKPINNLFQVKSYFIFKYPDNIVGYIKYMCLFIMAIGYCLYFFCFCDIKKLTKEIKEQINELLYYLSNIYKNKTYFILFIVFFILIVYVSKFLILNLALCFLFVVSYILLIHPEINKSKAIIGLSYFICACILAFKPTLLLPIFGTFYDNDFKLNFITMQSLSVVYLIILFLLLFSLQKTARKNSIIPS